MILAIGATLAAAPAQAQTYDPDYPVCMEVYAPYGSYLDCSFTSIPQCKASASGRGAQCLINPYFAPLRSRGRGRGHQGHPGRY
jgi:hypothetical protein